MNTALIALMVGSAAVTASPRESLPITRQGRPASRIVSIGGDQPAPLMRLAEQAIAGTVKQWDNAELPVVRKNRFSSDALSEPSIVLIEWDRLRSDWPDAVGLNDDLHHIDFLDRHGFVCTPVTHEGVTSMWVVGRSLRGLYNGAVYLRDFLIDGDAGNLRLDTGTVVRTPQMLGRPAYLLTIWGEEPEYSVEDYKPVFESFARDGITHIYFWLSGHFPSEKFPQSYKVDDNNWDSTVNSRIDTVEDHRQLIRMAHGLGMEFFIGGALGAWCGTFILTDRAPGTMRTGSVDEEGNDVSEWSLCPSSRRSQRALIDYYKEIYDALPEADGLFIESADEYGQCQCERCQVPVDEFGSKAFGRNQLALMREMMNEIWQDHPHARLAYTIGYSPHTNAPAYYETVRKMSGDPRIEWMEARNSWEFPGPEGRPLPAAFFSPRVMRWDYCDRRPLEKLITNSQRVASSGMYGYIMTFSPGFDSGSFYHDIPFPTDLLPYVLTHFLHREATWEPADEAEMRSRIQKRFFGQDAPPTAGLDMWALREILRESANKRLRPENRERLDAIEARIAEIRPAASPKTRAGLDLMTRAIDDIRRFCAE